MLLLLVSVFFFVFLLGIVLFFVYFWEDSSHLLFEQLLEFFLRFLVQVVLLTEIERKLYSGITLVNHYPFLLVSSEVDVHEEERLLLRLLAVMTLSLFWFLLFLAL